MNVSSDKLYSQFRLYKFEYEIAIRTLLYSRTVDRVFIPLSNLIVQYLENNLKKIIGDYYFMDKTPKSLKLDNLHDLNKLLDRIKEKYKKYLNIEFFNESLIGIEKSVIYMKKIFNDNILINTRYAIENDKNDVTAQNVKLNTDIDKLKENVNTLKQCLGDLNYFYEYEYLYSNVIIPQYTVGEFLNIMSSKNKYGNFNEELLKKIEACNKCNARC